MKKRVKAMLERWRQRRADKTEEIPAALEASAKTTPPADETVATDETPPAVTTAPRRSRATPVGLGLLALLAAVLVALALAPGLRDTMAGRKLRFWEKPAPPAPAVPPGQLAREAEEAQAKNPAGVITIDQDTAEALGLQTFTVTTQDLSRPVRTTGRVAPDERRITTVHTKVEGWIEEAYGNFEGQQIRKGQKLFTIYSPDLVATQQEYLIALRAREDFKQSDFDVVQRSGNTLVEAARRRLQLWDVTPQQIAEIERTKKILRTVPFYAPASGVVIGRQAFPGMRVTAETELYKLADLSAVWVEADVFQSDLPQIQVGLTGEVTTPDNATQTGRVAFIAPFIEGATRTAKVRLEFANPQMRLRPGMFVNVSLKTYQPPQIIVPRDAVIDTGARQLVLLATGNGQYKLREIKTGTPATDYYTVLEGVAVGEKVARNIQFLIDSETQLKQAVDRLAGPKTPARSGADARPNMPGMSHEGGKP